VQGNDILVVEGDSEMLIPMTEDHISDICRADGTIHVQEEALVE
jgi:ribosomal 30S subunit maturation factor RimM